MAMAEIVDENMANASARPFGGAGQGSSPEHSLIAFGGAAPLSHAARLAEKLAIASRSSCRPMRGSARPSVSCGHPSPSRWCAAAITCALTPPSSLSLGQCDRCWTPDAPTRPLEVVRAGCRPMRPLVEPRSAFMRYVGQGHEIVVAAAGARSDRSRTPPCCARIRGEYRALFSPHHPRCRDRDPDLVNADRHEHRGRRCAQASAAVAAATFRPKHNGEARASGSARCSIPEQRDSMARDRRSDWRPELMPGASLQGPALPSPRTRPPPS